VGRWAARRSARTRLRSGRRGCRAKRAPSKDHRLADVQVGRGMTEAAAAEVVKSWGVGAALAGPTGVVGWLAANVGIIVGQRTGFTPFLRGLPVAGTRVRGDRAGRSDLPRWIARRVPPRARRGAGNPQPLWHQSGWALDPRRAVHRCRCPAHRFRQDGRRPLSDPPATTPSPATGIDISRAGIARAVAENTTTIADQPTEEPVVSRTVRRACMTVRLFDKPRSRRC
jgi:hypothetical protein